MEKMKRVQIEGKFAFYGDKDLPTCGDKFYVGTIFYEGTISCHREKLLPAKAEFGRGTDPKYIFPNLKVLVHIFEYIPQKCVYLRSDCFLQMLSTGGGCGVYGIGIAVPRKWFHGLWIRILC